MRMSAAVLDNYCVGLSVFILPLLEYNPKNGIAEPRTQLLDRMKNISVLESSSARDM